MIPFLLWLILLALAPPLAVLAIAVYAVFWLLMLPLKLIAAAVETMFQTLKAIVTAPVRLVSRRA